MEENRPFMPPPPPKMPPPPPRPDVTGQTPVQPQTMGQSVSVQAEQPAQPQVDGGISTENVIEQSERNAVEPQDMAVGESVKREKTTKAKKKASLASLLYWGGFALCLVGIALSIYFLVR